jgi:hypothetical protein
MVARIIEFPAGSKKGKMRTLILLIAPAGGALMGQSLVGSGYTLPAPVVAAPGQLVTLIVQITDRSGVEPTNAPSGADLPTTLSGFSVNYQQGNPEPVPILQVLPFYSQPAPWDFTQGSPACYPLCTALIALTVQIPFVAQSCIQCPLANGGLIADGELSVSQNGVFGTIIWVAPYTDQVHIVTACDSFMGGSGSFPGITGLPCASTVTHADGSAVSATSPAQAGEELVAYAVGLGQTTPALVTGKLVTAAAATQTTSGLISTIVPTHCPPSPRPLRRHRCTREPRPGMSVCIR